MFGWIWCFDFESWVSLLLAVLFRGPETFHCERSVIQTSHWDDENWKPEWDVSHHFGLFKLSCKTSSFEKLLCHNWVSKVPTQSRKSHNTKRHTILATKAQKHQKHYYFATNLPQKWLDVVFVTFSSILTIFYDFHKMKLNIWC